MKDLPSVTIAFLSWNRKHYLKASVESAKHCIEYPDIEWILSDNDSGEPGMREYLESLDWLDRLIVRRQSHAEAMNEIVKEAKGEYIIIWPDDVQFVVKGTWLQDMVEILEAQKEIGSVCLDYMRRSTIETIFSPGLRGGFRDRVREIRRRRGGLRRYRKYESSNGYTLLSMGWMRPGVVGSGIPSLTATDIWRNLGPWKVKGSREEIGLVDSSLGAESDMLQRAEQSFSELHRAAPLVPVAADIITDPLGCKAKIRGGYRYGVYMPPPDGTFYYRINPLDEITPPRDGLPLDFNGGVEALGYRIPRDRNGERKKADINTSVVFDLEKGVHIEHPLAWPGLAVD